MASAAQEVSPGLRLEGRRQSSSRIPTSRRPSPTAPKWLITLRRHRRCSRPHRRRTWPRPPPPPTPTG
jgi:hypothetical protein